MNNYLLRFVACLFLCVSLQSNASFYDIKVEASGVLTYVDEARFTSIDEGDGWSVTINYEDVWFGWLHGGGATYQGGIVSGTFQIGSHTSNFSSNLGGNPPISVGGCYGCLNELHLFWDYTEYFIDDIPIGALELRVTSGLNPPSLSNTNLTDITSVINDFEFSLPNPSIMSRGNRFVGSIQNFSISEVPLPAGIYLFLTGLVGLGLIKKSK